MAVRHRRRLVAQVACCIILGGRENTAFAYAFLARYTGSRQYREIALWLLQNAQAQDKVKEYGMAYRSTAYATYYLSRLADRDPLFAGGDVKSVVRGGSRPRP